MALLHGHWKTTTLVVGLSVNGIVAPMVVDRAINRVRFGAYVEQALTPVLTPGDIVVMDNLSGHKGKRVRELIAAGARLRLSRPMARTSARWRTPSRRSRLISGKPPSEPSTAYGTASARSSTS